MCRPVSYKPKHARKRTAGERLVRLCPLLLLLLVGAGLLAGHWRGLWRLPSDVGPSEPSAATTASTPGAATTQTPLTTARPTTATTTTAPPFDPPPAQALLADVPVLAQMPRFPTGCESVSAVMALQYAGVDITVKEFIDNHLPCSDAFTSENGVSYGPDPNTHFLGNPYTESGYGCFAPVIEQAMASCLPADRRVENVTGQSMEMLCSRYIARGTPVIMWATIGMIEVTPGPSWTLPDGRAFTWPNNEHCLVLIGYDAEYYHFCDPYRGVQTKYRRSRVEERYEALGRQALVVL